MNYQEIAKAARGKMGPCRACPVCDGRACGGTIPGPGCKGSGTVATRNREAWERYRLVMDTIGEGGTASTAATVLGRELSLPVMVGPLGDVRRHYGDLFDDVSYNGAILAGAAAAGTLGWTGDGLRAEVHERACGLIASLGGAGVTTIKPWSMDVVGHKLDLALAARPAAVAMDVDAAGLPFLKGQQPPAGAKTVGQLGEIAARCHEAGVPFVVKGVLSPRGAEKAAQAGADAVVVSNHGGRVLDGVAATAEVLPGVVDAVGGEIEVLVDGGVRSGVDVLRALALGATAVLMCRPFAVCVYGAGQQGVEDYLTQLAGELADAMEMCGMHSVAEVSRDLLVW